MKVDHTYWSQRLRELKHNDEGKEELVLEGEGPYRLSFIIRLMTNEPEAAKEELAELFNAYQGRLGTPVRWLYTEKGEILVSKYHSQTTEDQIMLAALSVGAEDVEFGEGDVVRIICAAGKLEQVAELLEFEDDVHVYAKRLCYQPQALFDLHGEQEIELVIALMEALAEREDVLDVAADFELDDLICKKMGYDVY